MQNRPPWAVFLSCSGSCDVMYGSSKEELMADGQQRKVFLFIFMYIGIGLFSGAVMASMSPMFGIWFGLYVGFGIGLVFALIALPFHVLTIGELKGIVRRIFSSHD